MVGYKLSILHKDVSLIPKLNSRDVTLANSYIKKVTLDLKVHYVTFYSRFWH